MNRTTLKYFIVIIGSLLCILALVYGSYLPFRKSQLFIRSLQATKGAKTVEDLKKILDVPLNYYSPVGNEEVVKFFANDISSVLRTQSDEVGQAILSYFDPYIAAYNYDLRMMLQRGFIYQGIWQRFKKDEYYLKAEESFRQAYTLGPKVPRAIYSLLSLYVERGHLTGVQEIGSVILQYWPDDAEVKRVVEEAKKLETEARAKQSKK